MTHRRILRVGFTGTRQKTTIEQEQACALLLWTIENNFNWSEFRHGGCYGWDSKATQLAAQFPTPRIICHPSQFRSTHDELAFKLSRVVLEEKRTKTRNFDIVNNSDLLVACPANQFEDTQSGTWQTVRMARNRRKPPIPIVVVWPNGQIVGMVQNETEAIRNGSELRALVENWVHA